MTRPRRGQRAFWNHDLFPHLLSGEVTMTRETPGGNFLVQTVEYGVGHWFRPRFVLTPVAGALLDGRLRALKQVRASKIEEVRSRYEDARAAILREAGVDA